MHYGNGNGRNGQLCLKLSSYAILIELKSQGLDPKSAAAVNQNGCEKSRLHRKLFKSCFFIEIMGGDFKLLIFRRVSRDCKVKKTDFLDTPTFLLCA